MIVWGGDGYFGEGTNTGGRYNPSTDSWAATSTTNAASARDNHAAVWTGSEMIVWGGYSFNGPHYLNTGARYDPATDTWTSTSTTNAPAARVYPTAIWTDSEMIVWGGIDGIGNVLNSGGRYNPTTDSWTATSTINAPSARAGNTAVWTGSEMIVWGGPSESTGTGGKYNPTANSWTATSTSNAPSGRFYHTAIWIGSEMIVWGGVSADFVNTGGRYNPDTDSWMATSTRECGPAVK